MTKSGSPALCCRRAPDAGDNRSSGLEGAWKLSCDLKDLIVRNSLVKKCVFFLMSNIEGK